MARRERCVQIEGREPNIAGWIAREHDISPRTVEVYRANVMTKMQAANISELVKLAIRSGTLDS